MKLNKNAVIFIIMLLLLIFGIKDCSYDGGQAVGFLECYSDEDCKALPSEGYCDVDYGCESGRCWTQDVPCPEQCDVRGDEDKDGLWDCDDPDCWQHAACDCSRASFGSCTPGRCYCKDGSPRWVVTGMESYCICY